MKNRNYIQEQKDIINEKIEVIEGFFIGICASFCIVFIMLVAALLHFF